MNFVAMKFAMNPNVTLASTVVVLIACLSLVGLRQSSAQEKEVSVLKTSSDTGKNNAAGKSDGRGALTMLAPSMSPQPKLPDVPLRALNPGNQQLILSGYHIAKRVDIFVRAYYNLAKQGPLTEFPIGEISKAHVANLMLGRIADELELLHEPAYADLRANHTNFTAMIAAIVGLLQQMPAYAEGPVRQALEKSFANEQKRIPSIKKLIMSKRFLEADKEIYGCVDRMELTALWLAKERRGVTQPFLSLRLPYGEPMKAEKIAETMKVFEEQKKLYPTEGFDLVTRVRGAGTQLSTGATATWGGESLSGPRILSAIYAEWQQTLPRLIRMQAITSAVEHPANSNAKVHQQIDYSTFTPELTKAIGGMIEADVQDCTAEEAPDLYISYVKEMAPLAAESKSAEFQDHMQRSLDKLLKLNPDFAKTVTKYNNATVKHLEWRAKIAAAQADIITEGAPDVSQAVHDAFMEAGTFRGFVGRQDAAAYRPISPVMITLRKRSHLLLDRAVKVPQVRQSPGVSDSLYLPYDGRISGKIPMPAKTAALEKEIALLKLDLLIGENAPPLTLPAATALWRAEHGAWNSVGAVVRNFTVEPTVSYLCALPNDSGPFLEMHYDAGKTQSQLGTLVFPLDFSEPLWFQHDYFIIDYTSQ